MHTVTDTHVVTLDVDVPTADLHLLSVVSFAVGCTFALQLLPDILGFLMPLQHQKKDLLALYEASKWRTFINISLAELNSGAHRHILCRK